MQEGRNNHWLDPVFARLGTRWGANQPALLVVMLAGCMVGQHVSAAGPHETSLSDVAGAAEPAAALEQERTGTQAETPAFPQNRLASDFRFRAEARTEPNSLAEMAADMPESTGDAAAADRYDLELAPRMDSGIDFDQKKWFTDWRGTVFIGVGTRDTWHTGLSLRGYLIPDRLSMGITTSVGRYRWGHWGWRDHPYWW